MKRWRAWLFRRRGWILVAGGLLLLGLTHPWWLPGVAECLIVAESADPGHVVVIATGDGRVTRAVSAWKSGQAARILIVRERPRPLAEPGIWPGEHERLREQLLRHGVPPESIEIGQRPTFGCWDLAAELQAQLRTHPKVQFAVLVAMFDSGRLHRALVETLSSEDRARVRLIPLGHPDYDASNWWHSRAGCKEVVHGYLRRIHLLLVGRPPANTAPSWTIAELKRTVRSQVEP